VRNRRIVINYCTLLNIIPSRLNRGVKWSALKFRVKKKQDFVQKEVFYRVGNDQIGVNRNNNIKGRHGHNIRSQ